MFGGLARLRSRRDRMLAYRQAQVQLSGLTEADLADMGAKRYQLDHAARVIALG